MRLLGVWDLEGMRYCQVVSIKILIWGNYCCRRQFTGQDGRGRGEESESGGEGVM